MTVRLPGAIPLRVLGLCVLIGGSGVLHFVVPGPYRGIMPGPLRAFAAPIVALSGAAEILCAALLAWPRTRWLGAWTIVALLLAVFPANVQMALDSGPLDPAHLAVRPLLAWLRLPLQVPLVIWAASLRHRIQP